MNRLGSNKDQKKSTLAGVSETIASEDSDASSVSTAEGRPSVESQKSHGRSAITTASQRNNSMTPHGQPMVKVSHNEILWYSAIEDYGFSPLPCRRGPKSSQTKYFLA